MSGALRTASGDVTTGQVASGTQVAVARPGNAVGGDTLLAVVHARQGTAAPTSPPAGWTQVAGPAESSVGFFTVWARTLPASLTSEPTSYTWAGSAAGRHVALVARTVDLAVADLAGLVAASGAYATAIGGNTADARLRLTTLTTDETFTLLLAIGAVNTTGGTAAPMVPPSTMTAVGSALTATGASDTTLTVAQQLLAAAGATGVRELAAGSPTTTGSGAGFLLALRTVNKPAPSALAVSAGADQTGLAAASPTTVAAAASGGTAPYAYAWAQVSGPTVALSGSGASRSLTTPSLPQGASLTFRVTVTDAVGATATDTVDVGVAPNGSTSPTLTPLRLPARTAPRDLEEANADLDLIAAWITANGLDGA